MSDYYFTMPVDNRRTLCISPLTCEEIGQVKGRGNGLGYYLYERDDTGEGVTVLAKVVSTDAAVQLYEALRSLGVQPKA
jgi:hypothetical protein